LFPGEKKPVFNHLSNTPLSYFNLRRIPAGNTYSFAAAKACITGAGLGHQGYTDFLAISLSSTDYIGHQYGLNAIETEDTYYRLDKDVAEFIQFLDSKIGKGNYLLFLTADHGGAHSAPYVTDIHLPGGNLMEKQLRIDIKAFADAEMGNFGGAKIIRTVNNDQVYLDEQLIRGKGQEVSAAKKKITEWLEQRREIAYVIDMKNIGNEAVPEPIKTMAINGYSRFRSGSLQIVFNPGWYGGYQAFGTTHGTWHPYDAHIPLLWYGWKVKPGSTNRLTYMEDIAPTLASMLHVQMPNGSVGKVITEISR
jgi:arylsulfatase A-like enzyme